MQNNSADLAMGGAVGIEEALQQCAELIRSSEKCVITTHINSDGDAIGSQLGLFHLLRQLGKDVWIMNATAAPGNLLFLAGSENVRVFEVSRDIEILHNADAVFVLDVGVPARYPGIAEGIDHNQTKVAVIDHHPNTTAPADYYAVDTEACATALLIGRLVNIFGKHFLTREVADALYTGIMTDTGNFRFPKTTAEVHRMIADFLEVGVEPHQIYEQVYNTASVNRMHLLGKVLADIRLFNNDKACILTVTHKMLKEANAELEHTENIVGYSLAVRGVVLGVLAIEANGMIKLSFRSKGSTPANAIAQHFDGGGHLNAAGARVVGQDLQEVLRRVEEVVSKYL